MLYNFFMKHTYYSFSAIVNQDDLKILYLANIVNPYIGGLLISGPKGSGKSTVVRSVQNILPEYRAVKGCPFNCDPSKPEKFCSFCREKDKIEVVRKKMKIVDLPLSCTEDRLVGSIDVEKLLKEGRKEVEVGILGEANRNILYIDEVNLLPDHLVDDILDAAALHWNRIEREGISIIHPSEFVLVGTMNPEEGELRPQILDRFPLCVKVESVKDPGLRAEIVKRNIIFEEDPESFYKMFEKEEEELKSKILNAKEILKDVKINEKLIEWVSGSCAELKVDGQRPDIVIVKTAMTITAIQARKEVKEDDILYCAKFALIHRTREGGLLPPPEDEEIADVFKKNLKAKGILTSKEGKGFTISFRESVKTEEKEGEGLKKKDYKLEKKHISKNLFSDIREIYLSSKRFIYRFLKNLRRKKLRISRGKRKRVFTEISGRSIRVVKYIRGLNRIAAFPTILNAVRKGHYSLKKGKFGIKDDDFLAWQKMEEESLTLIIIVDVSSSTFPYINVLKEIILSLKKHFRRHNDRIGLISLQGLSAKILNHPTKNQNIILKNLSSLKIHGDTPLADALLEAIHMARLEKVRKPGSKAIVLLLSDCHPEPITHKYEDIFDEPAYQNAIKVASLYKKEKIPFVIINPIFIKGDTPGERLSSILAGVSKGKLIKLKEIKKSYISDRYVIPQRELNNLIVEIEKFLG